jgi:hypothetical protein
MPKHIAQIIMPKASTNTHRIQRHFLPIIYRSRFSPERLLTPPPNPFRTLYSIEPTPLTPPPSPTDSLALTANTDTDEVGNEAPLIPKPPGEVARPGRNGYTLRAVVPWDDVTYHQVHVRLVYFF